WGWWGERCVGEKRGRAWEDMAVWIPPGGKGAAALSQVSCKKAIGKGLTFRSPEDTAKATLEWFQSLPEEKRKNVRGWLKPEREAEVLAAWHAKTATKGSSATLRERRVQHGVCPLGTARITPLPSCGDPARVHGRGQTAAAGGPWTPRHHGAPLARSRSARSVPWNLPARHGLSASRCASLE